MTPPTIGLGVAQSHRPGFGCAHPTHASLPLPWESDLRSSSVHSWSRTQGLGRHSPSMLLGCLQQLQGVRVSGMMTVVDKAVRVPKVFVKQAETTVLKLSPSSPGCGHPEWACLGKDTGSEDLPCPAPAVSCPGRQRGCPHLCHSWFWPPRSC